MDIVEKVIGLYKKAIVINEFIELEKSRKLSKEEKTIAILVRENWQIETIIKGCKELDEEVEIETKVGGDCRAYSRTEIDDYGRTVRWAGSQSGSHTESSDERALR